MRNLSAVSNRADGSYIASLGVAENVAELARGYQATQKPPRSDLAKL